MIRIFGCIAILIGLSSITYGQISSSYYAPKEYTIEGIEVEGAEYLDASVVISVSGLYRGKTIKYPGDQIGSAIKKLWNQGLFADVKIYATKFEGDDVWLLIKIKERPRLSKHSIRGVRKSDRENIRDIIDLHKDQIVTKNLKLNTEFLIKQYFADKGRLNAKVTITQLNETDSLKENYVILDIDINKGKKVRIQEINFEGNKALSDRKLRKSFDETKRFRWWNVFKDGTFQEDLYETDKLALLAQYNQKGFRDARIVSDTVYSINEKRLNIDLKIEEGNRFYFRNITWQGNSKYSDEELQRVLGINSGDVFDQQRLSSRLMMDPNGTDISSLYLDDGYLFFNANPKEIRIENDSIDLEIQIYEGRVAMIDKVTIVGNTKTSDHVILREIRTKPGTLFRRSDIMRSQRELAQLGYFNAEKMAVNPKPNPQTGTVDIEYVVEEQPSDQVELSAGFGGGRLVGTLGLSFNNFSTRKLFKKKAWAPYPGGDGQRVSLRAQSNGVFFQGYSFSFVEPWLGGKKPKSFSLSLSHTRYNNQDRETGDIIGHQYVSGISMGLGKRLRWPDDFFSLQQTLSFQYYDVDNFQGLPVDQGFMRNLSYEFKLSRNSVDAPIYPRSGSNISFTAQFTPPYSSINSALTGKDYSTATDQEKFRWVEFHKYKFQAEWYNKIVDDLVLFSKVNFGILGHYNSQIGSSPFERFYLGGNGLQGFAVDGREVIALRGYSDPDDNNTIVTPADGGVAAVKYTMELRYPISLNPQATVYGLAFVEGGQAWSKPSDFSPFDFSKAAGVGFRVFMPMFGTLGVDFGYGFDQPLQDEKWQPTFIIGGNFSGW